MTRIDAADDAAAAPHDQLQTNNIIDACTIKPSLDESYKPRLAAFSSTFSNSTLPAVPINNNVNSTTAPAEDYDINGGAQLLVQQPDLHVVMVPFPLQGHINPMMQFAKALIAKHPHIRITIVNSKHNHQRIQQTLRSKSTLLLPRTASQISSSTDTTSIKQNSMSNNIDEKPSIIKGAAYNCAAAPLAHDEEIMNPQFLWVEDGLPPDFDSSDIVGAQRQDFRLSLQNMKEPLKQLLQSLIQKRPSVSCVVFGSFCSWVHTICVELGAIPTIFFWTQSASVLSIYHHAPLLASNNFFPYKKEVLSAGCNEHDGGNSRENISEVVSYIPGVPPLYPSSFPTLLQIDSLSEPSFKPLREQFTILKDCQGIIIHSFEELEKDAYRALQAELPIPVSLVGPLLPSAFLEEGDKNDTSFGTSLLQERSECMDWLNSQKTQSVLYVSFGSLFTPPADDLHSIACGIKATKQPFLWVLRPTSSLANVADILPKDFMDDTKDYGLIIPWAPQVQVLSHPSVGAFLTHCGWNSTLESVSMGVPMIPFPIFSDQPTNCAYVCDVWKVGMALKRQDDGKVRSMDVERAVRTILGGEKEGEDMRERAQKLKEAARQATRSQGSSSIHIESFVHTIKEKNARRALST